MILFTTDPNILLQCHFIFHITIPFLGLIIFIYIFNLFISPLLMFLKTLHSYKLPWKILLHIIRWATSLGSISSFSEHTSEALCAAPIWTLAKLATFPLCWSYSFLESMLPLSCFIFPFHWRTPPWRSYAIHMSEWERKKLMGTSLSRLTGRLHCCNQVASCLFAGKSPWTLGIFPGAMPFL